MLLTLALAILCLFLLRSMFVAEAGRRLRHLPVLFVLVCVLAALVARGAIERAAWVPKTNASEVVKAALIDMRAALADPGVVHVVILDGGSYPARGLDGQRLQQRLETGLGEGVAVLQLTLPGANHYERASMYRMFMGLLSAGEIEALAAKDVSLLLEIAQVYDTRPLSQFEESRYSDRAYAYLSPGLASSGFYHWRRANPDAGWIEAARFAFELGNHAAVNGLGVGALGRYAPIREVGVREGFQPHAVAAEGYRFRGLSRLHERISKPSSPRYAPAAGFLESRDARVGGVFAPLSPRIVRYAVLTARPDALIYALDLCQRDTGQGCIAPDHQLVRALDDPGYWRDDGHLVLSGSAVYSEWLADRLAGELTGTAQEAKP